MDPIKQEHDALEFDWLTSKFILIFYFSEALFIIVQVNKFYLILTDSVIINIMHILSIQYPYNY